MYKCIYCGKKHNNMHNAYQCYLSHDLVLVPLSKSDLQVLIRFLYTGDLSILTESLVNNILKYSIYRRKDNDT